MRSKIDQVDFLFVLRGARDFQARLLRLSLSSVKDQALKNRSTGQVSRGKGRVP